MHKVWKNLKKIQKNTQNGLAKEKFCDIIANIEGGLCMRAKTKFYGYRAVKSLEDKRISRLKRLLKCRSNTKVFQIALENLEEKILPKNISNKNI